MIELEDVSKAYAAGAVLAVDSVSLRVEPESVQVLLGESGSGKTTTLKMINRLIERTSGRILVDGEDVAGLDPIGLRRRIGYVFQGIGLFPHLTVAENIGVVPRLLGWSAAAIDERVDELLTTMALPPPDYRSRFPRELSGGQQQRIGVARALAAKSRVLLMDEPFGALDPITRQDLQAEFRRLQRSLGLTVVLVTHDVSEALRLADRIAVMKSGRLLGNGTPEDMLNRPPHDYIRALMDMPKQQAKWLAELGAGPGAGGQPT